jgi:hypothetical protein
MAMEVVSKSVGKHALPIIMLGLGLSVLAIVASHSTTNISYSAIKHGLFSSSVTVHQKKNGLADIKLVKPAPETESNGLDNFGGITSFRNAGNVAENILVIGAGGESRTPVTSLEN